jgi:hypothetical protein
MIASDNFARYLFVPLQILYFNMFVTIKSPPGETLLWLRKGRGGVPSESRAALLGTVLGLWSLRGGCF